MIPVLMGKHQGFPSAWGSFVWHLDLKRLEAAEEPHPGVPALMKLIDSRKIWSLHGRCIQYIYIYREIDR